MRWAGGRTLAAALERQAVRAELIRPTRTVSWTRPRTSCSGSPGGRVRTRNCATRWAIGRSTGRSGSSWCGSLLEGKATASTLRLAPRAVAARERTFGHTIEGYVTLAAAQKNRVVATVRVARPLTDGAVGAAARRP